MSLPTPYEIKHINLQLQQQKTIGKTEKVNIFVKTTTKRLINDEEQGSLTVGKVIGVYSNAQSTVSVPSIMWKHSAPNHKSKTFHGSKHFTVLLCLERFWRK